VNELLVVLGALCGAWVLKSILLPLVTAELLGTFDDYLRRRVLRAAAVLPGELAGDLAEEWIDEVEALGPRRARAWLYTQGLARAATTIAATCDTTDLRTGPQAPSWAPATSGVSASIPASLGLRHPTAVLETEDEYIRVKNLRPVAVNVRLVDNKVYVAHQAPRGCWQENMGSVSVHRVAKKQRRAPPTPPHFD
jgi:hypothetical protein